MTIAMGAFRGYAKFLKFKRLLCGDDDKPTVVTPSGQCALVSPVTIVYPRIKCLTRPLVQISERYRMRKIVVIALLGQTRACKSGIMNDNSCRLMLLSGTLKNFAKCDSEP
jgi:hypothetical protein